MGGFVGIPNSAWHDVRLERAGLAATGLWALARAYCGTCSTDGAIPRSILHKINGTPRLVRALVEVGLWSETDDGWRDVTYLECNRDASTRETSAELARKRAEASRAKSRGYDAASRVTSGEPAANVRLSQTQITDTDHRSPDQNLPPCPPSGGGRATLPGIEPKAKRAKATRGPMPADYQPADDIIALAASLGVDLARETAACRDYFASHGKPMADWHATLRGWVRRAPTFARTTTKGREIQQAAPVNDWLGADKLYGQGYCD